MSEIELNKKLFNYIKNHQWDEFIDLYKKNYKIDLNIQDEYNNYLVYYVILYNKLDILKQLRNIKLDFFDNDGKTILYLPIKFGYNEILDYLIDSDELTIGYKIVDIVDINKNTSLKYCLNYNNVYAFNKIINKVTDINLLDKLNNNILQISIYNNNKVFIDKILKIPNIDINNINKDGVSALHIACLYRYIDVINILIEYSNIDINLKETKYKLTPIMYLTDSKYLDIVKKLIKKGADLTLQDINGNTLLHYTVIENFPETTIELLKYYNNLNIVNVDGKLVLHLCLESINITNYPINELIKNTSLNIQDMDGNTCGYILYKKGLWINYKEELKKKSINIFIENRRGDIIYNKDINPIFLDIVVEGYYNRLLTGKKKWLLDWENKCGVKTLDISECKKHIKLEIIKQKKSVPYNNNYYNVNIDNILDTSYNTFVGIPLDIMCGCLLLIKNSNDVYTSLNLGVHFINKNEISNIEILWSYFNLKINNLSRIVEEFLNSNKNFLVLPLGIELNHGGHANILIYDRKNNIIERFEPFGNDYPIDFYYNPRLLDELLEKKFIELIPNCTYVKPKSYLPNIGFQYFEAYQEKDYRIGDPNGFCAAWCFWYVMQKVKNPTIESQKLVLKLLIAIKNKNLQMRQVIRSFAKEITDIRDDILIKNGININKFVYEEIDKKTIEEIEKYINIFIKNIT